ncbi:type II toxin-antitoxin system VapC family toxin [Cognataquiflexum rubidum]|uniref:type II toxin-antitoxin system VapC family toxin n=1 Tax=Cognataquiflexum rubidum TaxID=2922273 RepID=UPI001F132B36|nr:type II toxin-antitoxin system VapC family toxin [Cognataquiflexum rubidum]MCH6236193.1 type II toxin-antitoxin system VapC family toxin [Cognataquiflexum rubidum]
MRKSILDTDTLINFFDDDENTSRNLSNYLSSHPKLTISELTVFEFFQGLEYKQAQKQMEKFETFISKCEVLNISHNSVRLSAKIYADLRRKGITIGEIDLLIAGIAIHSDLQLITNNTAHFAQIQGLSLHNWK